MESHVDVQTPNESICKEQAPRILKVIIQPTVMVVEEIEFLLCRQRGDAIDNRPNFALMSLLALSLAIQVNVQCVQYQTGMDNRENSLIAAPTCSAGRCWLEIEKRNVEKFAFADPRQRILSAAVSKRIVDLSGHLSFTSFRKWLHSDCYRPRYVFPGHGH